MNYAVIKDYDIANGKGVRVSLFVTGCRIHCKNCFNAQIWDFAAGKPFTEAEERHIFEVLAKPYVAGLSILGGEPMEPENREPLAVFAQKVKQNFPNKTIWCYTGYRYETVWDYPLLQYVDVLVDGKYDERRRNIMLAYRGSENQRIIDVKKTEAQGKGTMGEVVLWQGDTDEI